MNSLNKLSNEHKESDEIGLVFDSDYKKAHDFLKINVSTYFNYITEAIDKNFSKSEKLRVSDNEIILIKKSYDNIDEITYLSYFGNKQIANIVFNSFDISYYGNPSRGYLYKNRHARIIGISDDYKNVYGQVCFDIYDNKVSDIRFYECINEQNLYKCISIAKILGVWEYSIRHGKYFKRDERGKFQEEKNLFKILAAKNAKNSDAEKALVRNLKALVYNLPKRIYGKEKDIINHRDI